MKRNISYFAIPILIIVVAGIFFRDIHSVDKQCLESFDEFAYTPPNKNGDPKLKADTLPQEPWHIEAALPNISEVPYISFSVEAIRSTDAHNEIWIRRYSEDGSFHNAHTTYYQFLIYQVETKDWEIASAQVEGSDIFVEKIFITDDGSVWGQNVWGRSSDEFKPPILSKYNDVSGKFELVESTKNIPAFWRDSDSRTNDILFWNKIFLDSAGVFWIVTQRDSIYSYNPATQKTEKHADISTIHIKNAALSPDGSIYISGKPDDSYISNRYHVIGQEKILHYVPQTDELKVIENPNENWPSYRNLYIDRNNRLWLGSVGWFSPQNGWELIFPNRFLYLLRIEFGDNYGWVEPEILLESSDGRMWYRVKGRGMAWLDSSVMEGCWFTTYTSKIIEDANKTLWFVADGKLYKYDLLP